MHPETLEKIKRWEDVNPRKFEERYPQWVLWFREWKAKHKPLKKSFEKYSFIDFMEWKAENNTNPKN